MKVVKNTHTKVNRRGRRGLPESIPFSRLECAWRWKQKETSDENAKKMVCIDKCTLFQPCGELRNAHLETCGACKMQVGGEGHLGNCKHLIQVLFVYKEFERLRSQIYPCINCGTRKHKNIGVENWQYRHGNSKFCERHPSSLHHHKCKSTIAGQPHFLRLHNPMGIRFTKTQTFTIGNAFRENYTKCMNTLTILWHEKLVLVIIGHIDYKALKTKQLKTVTIFFRKITII